LREDIEPGHIVFPDQFIDHTRLRPLTFHEDKVVHTPMADPFCGTLRRLLVESATRLGLRYHAAGTIVTIEGPRFSTRAESHMFRAWGADIINMSTVPEVVLAREAGACYQSIAMSTDYDCWKEDEAPVTWEMIVQRMEQNADNVKRLLIDTIPHIAEDACACRENGLT
jgi:5'-methylthioadenosine phosphorylase